MKPRETPRFYYALSFAICISVFMWVLILWPLGAWGGEGPVGLYYNRCDNYYKAFVVGD